MSTLPLIRQVARQRGSDSQDGGSERQREWRILWKKPGVTVDDVAALKEIPKMYDPYKPGSAALANSISPEQVGRWEWRVTVTYSRELEAPEDQAENPLARPAEFSYETRERTLPILRDLQGRAITNTAGDPVFGFSDVVHDRVIVVSKNVASVPKWFEDIDDVVNVSDIRIDGRVYKARHLRFGESQVQKQEDAVRKYSTVTFRLHHRRESWDLQYPNQGFRELVEPDPSLRIALGVLGTPEEERERLLAPKLQDILVGDPARVASEPVWLDENGAAIRDDAGRIKAQLEPSELLFIRRRYLPEFDFTKLPLR